VKFRDSPNRPRVTVEQARAACAKPVAGLDALKRIKGPAAAVKPAARPPAASRIITDDTAYVQDVAATRDRAAREALRRLNAVNAFFWESRK
jgi:hypothetical protein